MENGEYKYVLAARLCQYKPCREFAQRNYKLIPFGLTEHFDSCRS
jgi:hypothetical protein